MTWGKTVLVHGRLTALAPNGKSHSLRPMCAKKYSPQPKRPPSPTPAPAPTAPAPGVADDAAVAEPSWLESQDPRRRMFAKIAMVAIWVYVGALWLLALDQWFNWGIFGTKIPPVP